jgi:hypothetical protein
MFGRTLGVTPNRQGRLAAEALHPSQFSTGAYTYNCKPTFIFHSIHVTSNLVSKI